MSVTSIRDGVRERLEAKGTYSRWVLFAALAGMFSTTFPMTILSVSLPDIGDEFGASSSLMAWVVTAPMLLSALALPVLGKLGDLRGHRRVFLIGFSLSCTVAGLTAFAWDPYSLIGLRVASQVIGAATQPTSMALVMMATDPLRRSKALGYWSLVSAGAPAIGLALGGPLVDAFGWRPIFVIQAGFGVFALALALAVLPEGAPKAVRFDLKGAAALTLGLGGIIFALGQGPEWGFAHPAIVVSLLVVPVGLVAFVRVERVTAAPLVPLSLFAQRNFTLGLSGNLLQSAAFFGPFVMGPIALRELFGLSTTATAGMMLLRTGLFSVTSPVGGHLAARVGNRAANLTGAAVLAAGLGVLVAGSVTTTLGIFAVGLLMQGAGNGMARPALTTSITEVVPAGDLGLAAAFQRMTQQIGNSFGITLLTAAYDDSGRASAFLPPFGVGLLLGVGGLACAWFMRDTVRSRDDATAVAVPA